MAEVDEPDTRVVSAGLNEDVIQLDVIVEDTLGLDLNEGIHQLSGQDLRERERDTCVTWWTWTHQATLNVNDTSVTLDNLF